MAVSVELSKPTIGHAAPLQVGPRLKSDRQLRASLGRWILTERYWMRTCSTSGGLRDGLAQLANQAFNLGFSLDGARMGPVMKRIKQLCPPGRLTGLEPWTALLEEETS